MNKKIINSLMVVFLVIMLIFTHISAKLEDLLVPIVEVTRFTTQDFWRKATLQGEFEGNVIKANLTFLEVFAINETSEVFVDGTKADEFVIQDNQIIITLNGAVTNGFIEIETYTSDFRDSLPSECIIYDENSTESGTIFVLEENDDVFIVRAEKVSVKAFCDEYIAIANPPSEAFLIVSNSTVPLQKDMIVKVYEGEE